MIRNEPEGEDCRRAGSLSRHGREDLSLQVCATGRTAFSESNIHAAPRYQRASESDHVQFITFRACPHSRGKVVKRGMQHLPSPEAAQASGATGSCVGFSALRAAVYS